MTHWAADLHTLLAAGQPVVRVVMAATRGSAPREAGACMLVHADGVIGSIGGGRLEHTAITRARALLAQSDARAVRQEFVLGKELEQCCGGIVELWWQRVETGAAALFSSAARELERGHTLTLLSAENGDHTLLDTDGELLAGNGRLRPDTAGAAGNLICTQGRQSVLAETLQRQETQLWLYGAGHVGRAIVTALNPLPFAVTWVDNRTGMLPEHPPAGVRTIHAAEPERTVADAPPDACFLVLTHDHALDFRIVQAILARQQFAFAGLIGSSPKALRFRQRLAREGLPRSLIDRLTCPIGIGGIDSKLPAAIAIAVTAQLLQLRETLARRDPAGTVTELRSHER